MSMRSWTEDGYGFQIFNGKPENFSSIQKFLSEQYPNCSEAIMEAEDEFELSDALDDPVPWKIAEAIRKIENVNEISGYQDDGDTDQEAMIGIRPDYPWNAKTIKTQEDADRILKKYMEMFHVEGNPDYFEAEYFG